MNTTRLILVGGFLGAGKTTLLWEAASRIMKQGKRTGLITNDQAPELVDTAFLLHHNVKVAEVSGSCFCCNFNGLIDAVHQVKKASEAEVIVAEPVGSCTDLSATILQPLKNNFKDELVVSPLTVLADTARLADILNGGTAGLHPSAAYIYRKQLEESDIILTSKTDQGKAGDLALLMEKVKVAYPDADVMQISAKTGEGIDAWLEEVMRRTDAGKKLVEVDYDVYAEGEAVLGWLNATIQLTGEETNWDVFTEKLLNELAHDFERKNAAVGHVKILLEANEKYLTGNFTGKAETIQIRGVAGISEEARLTLNARVETTPEELEKMVKERLEAETKNHLEMKTVAWRCLSPGRPEPTFRFDYVVPDDLIPPSVSQKGKH